MSKRDEAKSDYLSGMKYKDIAKKYAVSINTVKSWKSRYWNKEKVPRLHPKSKKVAHKDDMVAHKNDVGKLDLDKNEDSQNKYGLNPKQEYYCKLRAKQYPQFVAYRIAYDPTYRLSKSTLATDASILERNPKIKQRISKLLEQRVNSYHWDNDIAIEQMSEMYFKALESIAIHGLNKSNSDAAYNAFDRLNKLTGLDKLTLLQNEKLQTEINMLKVKIKQYTGSDNVAMTQLNQFMDMLKESAN